MKEYTILTLWILLYPLIFAVFISEKVLKLTFGHMSLSGRVVSIITEIEHFFPFYNKDKFFILWMRINNQGFQGLNIAEAVINYNEADYKNGIVINQTAVNYLWTARILTYS